MLETVTFAPVDASVNPSAEIRFSSAFVRLSRPDVSVPMSILELVLMSTEFVLDEILPLISRVSAVIITPFGAEISPEIVIFWPPISTFPVPLAVRLAATEMRLPAVVRFTLVSFINEA